jgi:2-polyprenyl-3-methyl-5-hydroxy-6-metoxy-1,4-benzoquinol methylase
VADQATHPLAQRSDFKTIESWVLHLFHRRAYEEAAKYARGRRVLDWGCNDGFGIEMMQANATSIAGIDVAPQAVETARERVNARIELYDGLRSSFESKSFDLITSFQLIEHLGDPDELLREMVRVLAPDGTALFTTPNARVRLNPGFPPWNEYHVREFVPEELRAVLERKRIEVARARQRGVKLMPNALDLLAICREPKNS